MEELKLKYYPDPILRKKAKPLLLRNGKPDQSILRMLAKLKEACREYDGVGLAAQQVGLVLPIIVAGEKQADGRYKLVGVVNPKVVEVSEETYVYEEGCLSFPGLYIPIERPIEIVAEGWFDDIEKFERRELRMINARIFMHETDHINGILYIDRVDDITRQRVKAELKHIAKTYYKKGEMEIA
ncbi:peptide deformylase [bacterium]|nr:peptide deformylase [bacterium]